MWPAGGSEPFDLEDVDARVGSFLGCEPGDVVIKDMAVHPLIHSVYLSVQRGHGEAAQPVLVRIGRLDGAVTAHGLVKIACRDIDGQPPLTEPKQPVGVPRETKDLQGIRRLANLGGSHVLVLQSDDAGRQHLRSLKTASL